MASIGGVVGAFPDGSPFGAEEGSAQAVTASPAYEEDTAELTGGTQAGSLALMNQGDDLEQFKKGLKFGAEA